MEETKEAILALLSAANGLETKPYWPHPYSLDECKSPGNYANAESVERGVDEDKFNWIALSVYEEGSYVTIQDLKVQLEQLFADNEWCQSGHATIYHNEDDEMARGVEFRFHTLGDELSASPDGPDFCPSCGWNTKHLKCNAGPEDHPVEECHYLCANCGMNTGIVGACIPEITVNNEIKMAVSLTGSQNVILDVSPGVINAVGEIIVGYALAENNLRARMVNLPGHKPGSNLSADIERLKKQKEAIVASYSAQSADGGQAMEECIAAIVSAFERIHPIRTALAHGPLVFVGLSSFTIGRQSADHDADHDNDKGSRLQIEHGGVTVKMTEDGIQEPLDNVRELQDQVGRLGWILELLAGR